MVKQETPLGTLVARHSTDPNYPGICIYLQCGDNEELVARVECDREERKLAFQVWFDPDSGDPSHSGYLSEDEVNRLFEED